MAAIVPGAVAGARGAFTVAGWVREIDGTPIAGAMVEAYDQDFRALNLLGHARTDDQGNFTIRYAADVLKRPGKTNADLVVKALTAAGAVIAQSPVLFHAPAAATVDLTRDNKPYLGPSELAAVQARLKPILGTVAPADLTRADIAYLAGTTGLGAGQVPHLAAAAQLAKSTGLDAGVFYGLARQGMPTALTTALAADPAAQKRALAGALAANRVPQALGGETDKVLAALAAQAVSQTLAPGAFRLGGTLQVALAQAAEQSAFLTTLQANRDAPGAFWQALAGQPGFDAASVAQAQFATQLATLTQYHAPLVTALLDQQKTGAVKTLADLARLDPAAWINLLNGKTAAGAAIGVPPGVPGATPAIQVQNYAQALASRLEVAFPTAAITARLGSSTLAHAKDVAGFLAANPDFDIAATDANRYLAGKAAPAAVAQALPAMQRVFRVAPRFAAMEPLLAAGLTSARAIARMPESRFVQSFAGPLGGQTEALAIHQRARIVAGSAVNLFGRYAAGLNGFGPIVLAGAPTGAPQVPNWSALFGTADYCACTDCRSILSPAAYLVDLLHEFLDVHFRDGHGNSGAKLVLTRRPDIGSMKLDCDNTNTALPYIDLVNELLEDAVSPTTKVAHDTTDGASADLGAAPEYINEGAYGVVGAAVFPWGLPFDLGLAQARAYLTNLQTRRYQLMETFQPDPTAADPTDGSMTGADAVAADYLCLSPLGWKILLGTTTAKPWELWGVAQADWQNIWTAAGKGPSVQAVLDQSGIAFQDLVDLLGTRFAAGLAAAGKPFLIQWADTATESCDPNQAIVTNLSEAALGKLLRFLRLRQALGATVLELDALVAALAPADLDAPFLGAVVAADRLRRALKLGWIEIAAWWGPIPTLPDSFGGTSLYQRLFLNPAVTNPLDTAFALKADGSELQDTSHAITDPAHQPTVLAGLQIAAGDLALLLGALPLVQAGGKPVLNLGNLSMLFRAASAARAWSLSVADFLTAVQVMNVSPAPSGAPAGRKAPFDRSRVADAQWLADQLALVRTSGFSLSDLAYLLLDVGVRNSPPAPAGADLAQQLTSLVQGLKPILAQNPPPAPAWTVLGTAFVESQLSVWLQLPTPALDALLGMTPAGFAQTMIAVLLDPAFVANTAAVAASDVAAALAAPVPANPAAAPALYYQVRALVRLKKIATIASRLTLQQSEVIWLVANAAALGWLDVNALPAAAAPPPPLYPGWANLVLICRLRGRLAPGQPLMVLLPPRPPAPLPAEADYLASLASLVTWPLADLKALTGAGGFDPAYPNGFYDPALLGRLDRCFTMLAALGATVDQVTPWTHAALTVDQANDIVSLVKGHYAVAQWPAIGKGLRDPLRARQRDALVGWLLANSQTAFGQSLQTPDDLFGQLLIDTQMSPCMQTSRLIQATQSLQLYASRGLMGLEPGVTATAEAPQIWTWMQQYRLWQANREVFLYPENWLDPTLRDDKTDFFQTMEQELHKSQVTADSVETAYRHYLTSLDAVAHLRVCGMYHDRDAANGIDVVHVFARNEGTPPAYYWRQFVNNAYWTQWQKVDLDIPGVDVVPVVYNRRLMVLWPLFKVISMGDSTSPIPSAGDSSAPIIPPKRWVQVRMAWSQYGEDKWSAKSVADATPLLVPVSPTPSGTGLVPQAYESATWVAADCVRPDRSIDPGWFAFKATPPAPDDPADALQIQCFIRYQYQLEIQLPSFGIGF